MSGPWGDESPQHHTCKTGLRTNNHKLKNGSKSPINRKPPEKQILEKKVRQQHVENLVLKLGIKRSRSGAPTAV